jgi:HD superfamily phosphohydrolase
MNNDSFSIPFDPKSNLLWKYDAIHGYIDTKDEITLNQDNAIEKLLKTKALQRLRRVKQLGFASFSYTSADHSRYSHALGTLHMMRTILKHLIKVETFPQDISKDLFHFFSIPKEEDSKDIKIIIQHMLIAAVIQDAGELPYLQSTRHIFKPNQELKNTIESSIGIPIKDLSNKSVFTLSCIFSHEIVQILQGYSIPFLIWLITGLSNKKIESSASFYPLRKIVDGVVDADRLDYVYRDAHATIGSTGNPNSVVESLLFYDKDGPVFSDPDAVSNFLATRAHLYSTVYLDPTNRFYALLLVNFLKGVINDPKQNNIFFKDQANGELSFEDFLELDDISLFSRLNGFSQDIGIRRLNQKARIALEILLGKEIDYTCFWLPISSNKSNQKSNLILPDELFFDTFNDQKRFLYQEGTVRIRADRFSRIGQTIPLEHCGGPLNAIFKEKLFILPMIDKIMIYTPKKIPPKESWREFESILNHGYLDNELIKNDVLTENNPFALNPENKVSKKTFDVFLCHNSKDKAEVKRIGVLLKKKGISPWLDEWELPPGSRWQKVLQEQIKNIKSVAVFIGADGVGPWQDIEIEAFLLEFVKKNCKVIPVILKGCLVNPEIPPFLGSVTYVNFNMKQPNAINNLVWGINSVSKL